MPASDRLLDFNSNETQQKKEPRAMYGWPGVGILFTGKQAPIQPKLLEKLQKKTSSSSSSSSPFSLSTSSFWGINEDEDNDEMRLLAAFPFDGPQIIGFQMVGKFCALQLPKT